MTDIEINDMLREYIREICDMPGGSVRPAYQNAPAEALDDPYCIVNVINEECLDEPDVLYDDVNGKTQVKHHVKWFVSINFYNDKAFEKCQTLKDSFHFWEYRSKLTNQGLSYLDASEVRKLPEVINETWYDRAQVDLMFYEEAIHEIDADNIASANLRLITEKTDNTDTITLEE